MLARMVKVTKKIATNAIFVFGTCVIGNFYVHYNVFKILFFKAACYLAFHSNTQFFVSFNHILVKFNAILSQLSSSHCLRT